MTGKQHLKVRCWAGDDAVERETFKMLVFRSLLFTLLIAYHFQSSSAVHYEAIERLHTELLKSYNNQVIPLVDKSEPLMLTTSLTLGSFDFDEKEARFSARGFFSMRWEDPRLTWSPENYDGVTSVRLPSNEIWTPDLEVYNQHGKLVKERAFGSTPAVLFSNGSVIYVPLNSFESICTPQPANYPNDQVTCKIIVGSWTHSVKNIRIVIDKNATQVIVDAYNETPGWELVDNRIVSNEKIYECCPNEPYQSLEYSFVIKRKAPSAVFAVTIPGVLVAVLILGSLLIPIQKSSRLLIGIASLLMTCSYLLYFHSQLAPVGSTPLVVQYFGALSILISLTILQSAIGLRFAGCKSSFDSSKGFFQKLQNSHLLSSNGSANDGEPEVSWLTIFATVDKWLFVVYSITFAILIKAYLI